MVTNFINPYNFVSTSKAETRLEYRSHTLTKDAEGLPLLSGEIVCELTNKTPMLVGGKREEGPKDHKDHKEVSFFCLKDDRVPMVPASTLKGVIRGVYEAVTNSCFVFANKNAYEGKRTTESSCDVEVGIVEYLPQANIPGRLRIADRYLALPDVVRGAGFDPDDKNLFFTTHNVFCESFIMPGTEGKVPIMRIRQMSKSPQGNCKTEAYLHITGKIPTPPLKIDNDTIENYGGKKAIGQEVSYRCQMDKKNGGNFVVKELFSGNNNIFSGKLAQVINGKWVVERGKKHVVAIPRDPKETIELGREEYDRYLNVQRHGARAKNNRLELKPGDVVFFRKGDRGAEKLTRASLGRESFDRSILDLMSDAEQPCDHVNRDKPHEQWRVCPACQMFGLVEDRASASSGGGHGYAAAGRVRFTHARPENWDERKRDDWFSPLTPLQILSSPKPGCTPFYLRGQYNGQSSPALCKDGKVPFGYETRARLRGRKFYVSQPETTARSCSRTDGAADNQNMSARLMQPGKRFSFKVQFDGITQAELGALLYALELDGAWHGVGAGKPLGMGGCLVEIKKLLLHTDQWQASLDPDKRKKDETEKRGHFIDAFKALRANQEGEDFENIPAIRELKALRSPSPRTLPVMYPKKMHEYNERGRQVRQPIGYKWFMDHATLDTKRKGWEPQYLPLAQKMESVPLYADLDGRGGGPARMDERRRPERGENRGNGPRQAEPPAKESLGSGREVECVALEKMTKKGKRLFQIVGGDEKGIGCLINEDAVSDPAMLQPGARLKLKIKSFSPGNIQFEVCK